MANVVKFKQESYEQGRKWMANATFGDNHGQVGFANVSLKKEKVAWFIIFHSTHHSIYTMREMYRINAKGWAKK